MGGFKNFNCNPRSVELELAELGFKHEGVFTSSDRPPWEHQKRRYSDTGIYIYIYIVTTVWYITAHRETYFTKSLR